MENIKNIISHFIGKVPDEIVDSTVIDKTVVKGSILIHRMYAALANENILVDNYTNIRTYGDLINALNGKAFLNEETAGAELSYSFLEEENNIGLDIETLANLPEADDFREHTFYRQNFTDKEISYCSLRNNPRQSFLGLFCAKEALCKVSPKLAKKMFNQIEISHADGGRPVYKGYLLSISHTADMATAIAVKDIKPEPQPIIEQVPFDQEKQIIIQKNNSIMVILSVIAIVISVFSLLLVLLVAHR